MSKMFYISDHSLALRHMSNIFYIFILPAPAGKPARPLWRKPGDRRKVKQKRCGKRSSQYDPILLGPRAEKTACGFFCAQSLFLAYKISRHRLKDFSGEIRCLGSSRSLGSLRERQHRKGLRPVLFNPRSAPAYAGANMGHPSRGTVKVRILGFNLQRGAPVRLTIQTVAMTKEKG